MRDVKEECDRANAHAVKTIAGLARGEAKRAKEIYAQMKAQSRWDFEDYLMVIVPVALVVGAVGVLGIILKW